ncbi:MAG: glycosyltransferase, partial [Bacteroidales bacterium]|nr:glycosyltransferase [Bacteroidales bacterium]
MDISIIVPVYNASKYLRECLDSLVNQDFKGDYEIILVNDGSTDNSLSICQEYASKHPNITVLTGENGGVSVARNKGIDASRGDWFFFADADDLMTPDALTTLYQRQQETNADIVLGNAVYFKDRAVSDPKFDLPNGILPKPVCHIIQHEALWGFLIPASVVRDNHIRFVEGLAMGEDTFFCLQSALCCKTIAFVNKVIYVYRIHPESAVWSVNNRVRNIKNNIGAAYRLYTMADVYKQSDKE